jgi:hypothetical protein
MPKRKKPANPVINNDTVTVQPQYSIDKASRAIEKKKLTA